MRQAFRVCEILTFAIVVTLALLAPWGAGVAVEGTAPATMGNPQHAPTTPASVATLHGIGVVAHDSEPRPMLHNMDRLAPPDAATQGQVAAAYGQLPLHFEAHQGQTDGQVQFVARSQGMSLSLTPTEAVLVLPPRRPPVPPLEVRERQRGQAPGSSVGAPPTPPSDPTVLRLHFVGANPTPQVVGLEELPGKSNYFLGNDPSKWRTNIPTYTKVKYHEVYPRVDVLYYGNPRRLEYDIIVAPEADPSVITLAIAIEESTGRPRPLSLHLDAQDDLVLHTADGALRLHQPVVYQESAGMKDVIPCRYVLVPGPADAGEDVARDTYQLRVQVAAYDRSKPLIIDPALSYSTYLGGSSDDQGSGIAVDGMGNAYVTGFTRSFNFPTTLGAFQPRLDHGTYDVFVTKLNATGTDLVYSTYLGGSNSDYGSGIAVDGTGTAYVTGSTCSVDFPTTPGAFQQQPMGSPAFVTKLNTTGTALVYSTFLGGGGTHPVSVSRGIAVDGAGSAYVVGDTQASGFPPHRGPFSGNCAVPATPL